MLWRLTVLKLPTAYIVLPHWTIWRICSTADVVAGKCGIDVTGVASTGPGGVAACVAGANPATASAETAATLAAAASLE